jgi:hypothetical protein
MASGTISYHASCDQVALNSYHDHQTSDDLHTPPNLVGVLPTLMHRHSSGRGRGGGGGGGQFLLLVLMPNHK